MFFKVDNPDVAKLNGVVVPLEGEGEACIMLLQWIFHGVWVAACISREFLVFLHGDAIVDYGEFGFGEEFAFLVPAWGMEGDIVTLPFALGEGWVGAWGMMVVEGSGHAFGVGTRIGVRFEDLDFIPAAGAIHENDAAIATLLAIVAIVLGDAPFEMELEVTVGLSRAHVACGVYPDTVLDGPGFGAFFGGFPSLGGLLGAIKEDFGFGRGRRGAADALEARDLQGAGRKGGWLGYGEHGCKGQQSCEVGRRGHGCVH